MRRLSIRTKLMLLMILLTTLPVVTVTWIAALNTRASVEKEMIDANMSRMLWADQYLNELIQQINTLFYSLQINQQLMSSLDDLDSPNISVQYRTQNYVRETMTYSFHANSRIIDSLTLYSRSSQKAFMVSFSVNGLVYNLDIGKGAWSRLLTTSNNIYFKQNGDGTYAYHGINRFEDREMLGGMSVRINRDIWDKVGTILKSEPEDAIFLLNDEGELQFGSSEAELPSYLKELLDGSGLQENALEFHKRNGHIVFTKKINDGKLTLIKSVPSDIVMKSADPTIKAGLWTGALFVAASILLSVIVSLKISRPIISLAKTMRWTSLSNYEPKPTDRYDEIGLLERGYNSMMRRIKELIEEEYKREIEVKNAQLLALQAQINPHFLNNTLHLIGGMALAKNAREIYDITRVIGDLLRYSISRGGELVTLEEELKHTKNYLFIQEQRFAGRCQISIVEDPRAQSVRLPKLTLQPIVENAFEHGLQNKAGAWSLEVRCIMIRDRIVIMVKDEGLGIEEHRLAKLRSEMGRNETMDIMEAPSDKPLSRRGIGLHNVNSRLKLHYGSRYGVRIFSKKDVGTIIVLTVPVMKEAHKHV